MDGLTGNPLHTIVAHLTRSVAILGKDEVPHYLDRFAPLYRDGKFEILISELETNSNEYK